jgi:hypothetical protein
VDAFQTTPAGSSAILPVSVDRVQSGSSMVAVRAEGGRAATGIDPAPLAELGAVPEEVTPGVYFIRFDDARTASETFMRFQEHYESPEFAGKIFSREEFEAWYSAQKGGTFTYFTDWTGFNIPSRVVEPFADGRFDPLSRHEALLVQALRNVEGPFYVIATADEKAVEHEIAHGLFTTNPSYRKAILAILATTDLEPVFRVLEGRGYMEGVYLDEAHAHLLDGGYKFDEYGVDPADYAETIAAIRAVYERYYAKGRAQLSAARGDP